MIDRKTLAFILILIGSNTFGQVKESYKVISKKDKYLTASSCVFTFNWDSIEIKNKEIEKIINTSLKSNIYEYINNERYKIESMCDTSMRASYTFRSKIVFANDKVLSIYLSSLVDYNNGRAGEDNFETINYCLNTGNILNFNNLILKHKITEIDTLIIHRMTEIMLEYEVNYNQKYWEEQLNDLKFLLSENGINIFLTNERGGYNSNSWKQEIYLGLDEIKDFLNDKELFK